MKKRITTIFTIVAMLSVVFLALSQSVDAAVPDSKLKSALGKKAEPNVYIVLMSHDPAISYEGNIPGLRATKPGKGKKIKP